MKLTEGNPKLNDVFHVENEELVFLDSAVDYEAYRCKEPYRWSKGYTEV